MIDSFENFYSFIFELKSSIRKFKVPKWLNLFSLFCPCLNFIYCFRLRTLEMKKWQGLGEIKNPQKSVMASNPNYIYILYIAIE